MTGPRVRCGNNHVLVRWESVSCDAGHRHAITECRMRLGNKACGEQVVLPPFGSSCEKSSATR